MMAEREDDMPLDEITVSERKTPTQRQVEGVCKRYRAWICSLIIIGLIIILALIITAAATSHIPNELCELSEAQALKDKREAWNRFAGTYTKEAVATPAKKCSEMGAEVLVRGGNAIDAAIVAALCIGVVHPSSSGPMGGAFILTWDNKKERAEFIDAREVAPAAATPDMFVNKPGSSTEGGLAIAVPGELQGLHMAHRRGGKLAWSSLVMPVAELAENWQVTEHTAVDANSTKFLDEPRFAPLAAIMRPNGVPVKEGDWVQQPVLAQTLRRIANEGPMWLYKGPDAERLAKEIQDAGGIVTAADLAAYAPVLRDPIDTEVFDHRYLGAPPPSSGGATVSAILKFMAAIRRPMNLMQGPLTQYPHHLAEAMKHAFAMRMHLGDPAFVNVTGAVRAMTDDEWMHQLQLKLEEWDTHPDPRYYGGSFSGLGASDARRLPEDHGTTHISVVDWEGNAVALTSTINTAFGSKVLSESTGFVFNNEMDDFATSDNSNAFDLASSKYDLVGPGKRPLSSMSPSIILDKLWDNHIIVETRYYIWKVRMVVGASGGPRIITATAQTILNTLARGMPLLDAVRAPRIHSQLLPNVLYVEEKEIPIIGERLTHSDKFKAILRGKGHFTEDKGAMGAVTAIWVDMDTELLTAVSDPRKGGSPAGR
mmetsp:Transcript_137651/g.239320  ORF Transcript_137651/g.239320 Transcript_137651/m.239320 type:complete len:654 (-) Transcript_137651:1362-3323(-)